MAPRHLAVATGTALLVVALAAPPAPAAPPALALLNPKVISYYPATGGWARMWTNWAPARYAADLARISGLGATSVRIIVPARLFGFPAPAEPYLGRLRDLVALAAAQRLTVQLTLFDWFDDAGYDDIAGSEQWAQAILGPLAGDPRIAFVELRNEIDPNDPAAVTWAVQLLPYVRSLLLDAVPVTLSVSGADPAAALAALRAGLDGMEPDFYTVHLYGGGGDRAYAALLRAREAAAPVPIWLGETGYSTSTVATGFSDQPATPQAQEAAQAHYLKAVAWAAQQLGLPPPGIWALDDFLPGTVPGSVGGDAEYHYGLFRADGTPKPAAAVVRSIFGGTPPLAFNSGFDGTVAAGGGSLPAEWSAYGSTNAELAASGAAPRSGTGDAVVRSRNGAPAQGAFFVTPIASEPPAGGSAGASVWVRSAGPRATVRVSLEWLDASGADVGDCSSRAAPRSSGWTQLDVHSAAPPAAQSVRIVLSVTDGRGSVWFDDVGFAWTY